MNPSQATQEKQLISDTSAPITRPEYIQPRGNSVEVPSHTWQPPPTSNGHEIVHQKKIHLGRSYSEASSPKVCLTLYICTPPSVHCRGHTTNKQSKHTWIEYTTFYALSSSCAMSFMGSKSPTKLELRLTIGRKKRR